MTNPQEEPIDLQPEDALSPENGPTLEEALKQITALNAKAADAHDKMLRAMAEAENTRRRAEKDRQDTAKFSVSSFARDLLSVADNLRRALDAVPADQRGGNAIYEGVEATERELLRIFERNNISKVEPLNQKFDPNLHEVIFEMPSADKEPGTVMQVVQPGYMIHERLLRPARVGVAKAPEGDSATPPAGATINQEV